MDQSIDSIVSISESVKEKSIRSRLKRIFKYKNSKSPDNSEPSIESYCDVTPGSLTVWQELPEQIKYDPALAHFKQVYEEHHGKEDSEGSNVPQETKLELSKKTGEVENGGAHKDGCDRLVEQDTVSTVKEKSRRKKQIEKALRVIKLFVLVSCWVLLTVSLLMNQERDEEVLHAAFTPKEIKDYYLTNDAGETRILLKLTGPFQDGGNSSSKAGVVKFWLTRHADNNWSNSKNSTVITLGLQPDDNLDFSPSQTTSKTLILRPKDLGFKNGTDLSNSFQSSRFENSNASANREKRMVGDLVNKYNKVSLLFTTTSNKTVPVTITYQLNPLKQSEGMLYSVILLVFLYVLIIFEVVNRTIAALLSSSLGVAILAMNGVRPSLNELVSWLDMETLLLLFSMMVLVAILAETGLFDYLAVLAFELTGGRTWPLINCLCLFTALFSTFLDNVTTVLLMTPVTIRLCEVMQLNPIHVLMAMVIFSNVGGAATPVGDPPNVIIASHPAILRQGINFTSFTMHMGIGILLVAIQTYLQIRYMYRDVKKLRHSAPNDVQELRHELGVWKRAAASLSSYSRDEDIVRKALERKVDKISVALTRRETGEKRSKGDPTFCSTLAQMKQKYRIRDKPLLIKSAVCVSFVVIVFFLHAIPELQRLSLGWTALLGAILLLLLAEREDLEPILARVEWSTLLFFAALFVLMETLSKLGLIAWIGNMTESIILKVNEESRLAVALMLVLWVSGIVSAFVDNIPLTTMMVRVIAALADPSGLALPLAPLAWALSFGACLGGNGTLIGASANVVCAGVAEQHGYRFTFLEFLKVGFPIMIGNLLVVSVYLLVCHCAFTWH